MATFIKIIRWLISLFLTFIFILFIFVIISLTSISQIVVNQNFVKTWLKEAGLYDNALNIVLDVMSQQKKEEMSEDTGEESFFVVLSLQLQDENSEMGKFIRDLVTPEFLEKNVTIVIDATYDFLEGKTAKPIFEIKIAEDKDTMIRILSVMFKEKIRSLSDCSPDYVVSSDLNPFEMTCKPAGFDLSMIDEFISANKDRPELDILLNSMKISSDMINIDEQLAKQIQTGFHYLKIMPLISIGVIIFMILLLLLVTPGLKNGLIISGITLFFPSSLILIGNLIARQRFHNLVEVIQIQLPREYLFIFQNYFITLLRTIYFDVLGQVFICSIFVFTLSIILFVLGFIYHSKHVIPAQKEPQIKQTPNL